MIILHALSQLELTGSEVYVKELVKHQTQNGHKVFVISDNIHVQLPCAFEKYALTSLDKKEIKKIISNLVLFVRSHKIDVVHCHSRASARILNAVCRKTKTAMVTTLHGRQHYSIGKRLFNKYGEYILAICDNVKKVHCAMFKTHPDMIKVIPNPMDVSQNLFLEKSCSGVKKIAFIGRSTGPKGRRTKDIITNGFKTWKQTNPNVIIDIISFNPENFGADFFNFVKTENEKSPNSINFLCNITNVPEILINYDLVVCAGRSALECLLQGIPTMASGEYDFHGLATPQNIHECIQSNFGDIGGFEKEIPLDLVKTTNAIQDFLNQKTKIATDERKVISNLIRQKYDSSVVDKKIETAYKCAIFKKHHPKPIPVLMYHKVLTHDSKSKHKIFVTTDNFKKHLKFFKDQKFTSLTFLQLEEFFNLKKDYIHFPKKPIMLTFDDGYKNNLSNAYPLLKEFGFNATLFVLADHEHKNNYWDNEPGVPQEDLLNLEQKKELDKSVFDIGSHCFNHVHLNKINRDEQVKEIKNSKTQLETDLNLNVVSFAYPYGTRNQEIEDLVFNSGYTFAVNTDYGPNLISDNPHSIYRVNMFPRESKFSLWKKTSTWYRKYKSLKKLNKN